ncbi:MAG: hypothetical protein LIP06_02000 [Tannerellaceae bacterium]|nr:hypothetical protein [Tannerellaceae bacterium]
MKKLDFLNSGIIRSSLLISFITVFIKIAGYFEKLIIAYNWGTDESADIYNAVFAFIMSLFIFSENSLSLVF